jgi:long-chain fatty acid transport protein
MKKSHVIFFVIVFCFGLLVEVTSASNGMNMISCGFRASGMGGAYVALDGDSSGAACNPATLGMLGPRSLTFGFSILVPQLSMKNTLYGPNDLDAERQAIPLYYFGYAQRLGEDSPWTLGIVLNGQGGLGAEYQGVRTLVGTVDEFSSEIPFLRLNPSVSYRVNDKLSLGATALLGYARMEVSLYPETYSPGFDGMPGTPDDFLGMEVKGLSSWGVAARLGLQYKVDDRVSLGFSYTSKTNLNLDNGELALNFGPFGKVRYDAKVEQFGWPQQVEFGLGIEPTPKMTVAADVRWLGWSSVVDEVILKGSNPDLPVPLQEPEMTFKMKWEDQWVFAAGLEYRVSPRHAIRGGYNFGANPVPNDYVSPVFPASVEHHITFGYGLSLDKWRLDLAYERSFTNRLTNTNPNPQENPFGPDLEVCNCPGNVLHMGVSYQF